MEKELLQEQLIVFHPKTSFTILSKGRVVSIRFEELTHVSKYGNETRIYTLSGHYKTMNSLQEIMNDLPVNDFFRVHRSHIVSLRNMNGVKKKRIVVGEYDVPVSRYYKLQLTGWLGKIVKQEYFFYEKIV